MKRISFRRGWMAVAAVFCISATPVLAVVTLQHELLDVQLFGVDANGNLDLSLGTDAEFDASINTARGRFVGTARAAVTNSTGVWQFYINSGAAFFDDDVDITVQHTLYLVPANGNATLIADGLISEVL